MAGSLPRDRYTAVLNDSLRWCEAVARRKRVPVWARRSALAGDGTVYITGAVTGSEMDAVLSAAFDGVTIVRNDGHAYFPSDWLWEEYPHVASLVTKIERLVRAHCASGDSEP